MACSCPVTAEDLGRLSDGGQSSAAGRAIAAGADARTIEIAVEAIASSAEQIAVEARQLSPGSVSRVWISATTAVYAGPGARTIDGHAGHKSVAHKRDGQKGDEHRTALTYRNTIASKGGIRVEESVVYTVANALGRNQLQARPANKSQGLDGRLTEQARASAIRQNAPDLKAGVEIKASWAKFEKFAGTDERPSAVELESIAKELTRESRQATLEWAQERGTQPGESFFLGLLDPNTNEVAIMSRTGDAGRPWAFAASVPLQWNDL